MSSLTTPYANIKKYALRRVQSIYIKVLKKESKIRSIDHIGNCFLILIYDPAIEHEILREPWKLTDDLLLGRQRFQFIQLEPESKQ